MLNLQSPVIFPSSGRFFHRRSHVKGPTTHYPRDFQFPSLFSQFFSLSSSWELCPQGERRDPAGRHGGEADRLPPSLPLPLSLFSFPFPLSPPFLYSMATEGGEARCGRGSAEAARHRKRRGAGVLQHSRRRRGCLARRLVVYSDLLRLRHLHLRVSSALA